MSQLAQCPGPDADYHGQAQVRGPGTGDALQGMGAGSWAEKAASATLCSCEVSSFLEGRGHATGAPSARSPGGAVALPGGSPSASACPRFFTVARSRPLSPQHPLRPPDLLKEHPSRLTMTHTPHQAQPPPTACPSRKGTRGVSSSARGGEPHTRPPPLALSQPSFTCNQGPPPPAGTQNHGQVVSPPGHSHQL